MSYSAHSTLPLPCNTPGIKIDPKWEREHNVPRWFGWVANHLFSQIPLRHATTTGLPHREINLLETELYARLKADRHPQKNIFATIEHNLPTWLMGEFLFAAITTTSLRHPHTDVPKLLRQTIAYHNAQSHNEEVPSRKWKELRELIKEEILLLEPDRKTAKNISELQAIEIRSNLHCLQYALRAAYCIAEEKTPTTIAKCISNAVHSQESYTQKLNDTAYLAITEYLILQLGGTMPIPVPQA